MDMKKNDENSIDLELEEVNYIKRHIHLARKLFKTY